jgi:hypothetical protein
VVLGVSNFEAGAGGASCAEDCTKLASACQRGVCNEVTGKCVYEAVEDGAACDDGAFCTTADTCQKGVCRGGPTNDCGTKPTPCHAVQCRESEQKCEDVPADEGADCASNNLCMMAPAKCKQGVCTGTLKTCFGDVCNTGTCNPATGNCEKTPANEGGVCFDNSNKCSNAACKQGQCVATTPKDCSALANQCNTGACNPVNGQCVKTPANEGMTCTLDTCFTGQTCSNGNCLGGMPVPKTVYFQETFANNMAGWALGPEWGIGPAMASTGHANFSTGDPATDHTASTMDNGVAGVAIGGNAMLGTHGFYYLTSPVIDTASINGALWLTYWRFLNSDHANFMANRVEVWDGSKWVALWASTNYVLDKAWTLLSHEVTLYKNAKMQVRFGFNVNQGALVFSGWNLDDVALTSLPCSL